MHQLQRLYGPDLTICGVGRTVPGVMTPLERIQHAARYGNLKFGTHALDRMDERGSSPAHVQRAIATATGASLSDGAWRVAGGVDKDGDPLVVVVKEIQSGLFIVSLFGD